MAKVLRVLHATAIPTNFHQFQVQCEFAVQLHHNALWTYYKAKVYIKTTTTKKKKIKGHATKN